MLQVFLSLHANTCIDDITADWITCLTNATIEILKSGFFLKNNKKHQNNIITKHLYKQANCTSCFLHATMKIQSTSINDEKKSLYANHDKNINFVSHALYMSQKKIYNINIFVKPSIK